jgi:hypothetical protein
LDEGESFLKSYIAGRKWSGDGEEDYLYEGALSEVEEEEEHLEDADRFEASYNFRFEVTHAVRDAKPQPPSLFVHQLAAS